MSLLKTIQRRSIAAALLVLCLSACGGSGSKTAQQAAPLDSCALLTRADAEALLGGPVAEPDRDQVDSHDPSDPTAVSQCHYHTTGEDYRHVGILARRARSASEALQGFESTRDSDVDTTPAQPVSGVGEQAFWRASNGGQLTTLKGSVMLIVSADAGSADKLTTTRTAANDALARLQ